MANKKISLSEVKVGDKLIFNDGREKLTVTVTKINKAKGEIDVKWKTRKTWLLPSDFTNGYVSKL